jgi:signal transduction histidine kinase
MLCFPNAMKPVKNTVYNKIDSSESMNLSGVIDHSEKKSEDHILLRLHEMEDLNSDLEKLVGQRTKKLTETVATNAKFLSIIAHDLRSPFCSILGVMEILKLNLNDYDKNEIRNYLDLVYNSANSTLILLDSLLEWAISQNIEKSFNPVKINLHELLVDEIKSIFNSATQKHITLNHFVTSDLNVTADLQMVKTILRNLISNAIKYTNTGGEITISASESKQYVEIVITDNGTGMSDEAQRNLFKIEKFHSTAGTNNEQGTGLGLLLCKEFVEMHGGTIRVESEPGKGSKFKFTLPHYI